MSDELDQIKSHDMFCQELERRVNQMLLNSGPHKPSIGFKVAEIAKQLLIVGNITVYQRRYGEGEMTLYKPSDGQL